MKVLMVILQFYPMIGGTEKQAQLLAQKLIEKGIQVQLVTGWWKWGTPRREIINGIKIFRNFSFWGMFGIKGLRTLGALTYMVTLGIYLFRQRHTYDIIHVHQALYPAFVSLLIGKGILKKPVLIKTASSGITSDIIQLRQFPLGKMQLSYLLKKMNCLITVSEAGGEDYQAIGFPQSKILNIPNGVRIPGTGKSNYHSMLNVLAISRLSWEKGINILIQAWANVLRQTPNLKLFILGEGVRESALRTLSSTLGLDRSVFFEGAQPCIEKYLTEADLFVLPSKTEGLSNALLEAMSFGIPCIATQVGGTPEIFGVEDHRVIPFGTYWTTRYGIMTRPEDAEGLSNAMLYLMWNERSRQEIGIRARAHVAENYSIDVIAGRYAELYRSLLGRNKETKDR
jgi:glycosyltransferase involved in cell wall biosynthesis